MSYTLYTNLKAKSISYGSSRSASSIKYLVYHYTGNKTDSAKANANYFANGNTRAAGAHYFVDDTTVYQSIDDLKIAWAVGGSKYNNGGGSKYGVVTNSNSISIELCSVNGVITEATQNNAAELGRKIMDKYNISISNVYRHYDVTGKACPGWAGWSGSDSSKWNKFKQKLENKPEPVTSNVATFTAKTALKIYNSAADAAARKNPKGTYSAGSYYVYKTYNGMYNITRTKNVAGAWVNPVDNVVDNSYKVTVTAKDGLNCRRGAGTAYGKVKAYPYGTVLTISQTSGDWGKTPDGWVNLSYTKKGETKLSLYYPKYTGTSASLDTVLAAIGVPSSMRGSFKKRAPIAKANGISGYNGTAAQNTKLITLAKQGKLIKG